jgi:hypothetical protein
LNLNPNDTHLPILITRFKGKREIVTQLDFAFGRRNQRSTLELEVHRYTLDYPKLTI